MQEPNVQQEQNNLHVTDDAVEKFFNSNGESDIEFETEQENSTEPEHDNTESINEQMVDSQEQSNTEDNKDAKNYRAAMLEERERRKELQRQIQESQARTQQMEQKFQMLVQHLQQQQQQSTPPPPTFDESPLEALRYEQERLKQHMEYVQNIERQRQEHEAYVQRENAFINQYHNDAASFAQSTPDFKDAYQSLMSGREQELMAAGYSKEQARTLIIEDEKMIVLKAYQDRVNPAQRLYEVARLRGYTPQASQQNNSLQNMQKVKQAGMSLSKTSGSSPGQKTGITLEELVNMDGDDFDKNWEKVIKKLV